MSRNLLTHYAVLYGTRHCVLIGVGTLHEKGVLVNALEGEPIFTVPIIRDGSKRPNAKAWSEADKAITRTVALGKKLKNPGLCRDLKGVSRISKDGHACYRVHGVRL